MAGRGFSIPRLDGRKEMPPSEARRTHDELIEAIRGGQAMLLRVFGNMAEAADERIASVESDIAARWSRLAMIESRTGEAESRLNMRHPVAR